MNNIIKCPHCKKVCFDYGQKDCPNCGEKLSVLFSKDYFKDIFGDDNPFDNFGRT